MNFKDLENVKTGTVLIEEDGNDIYERNFIAIYKDMIITSCTNDENDFVTWDERSIKNWHIKKPAMKKFNGVFSFYGKRSDRDGGEMVRTEVINGVIYEAE